MDWELWPDSLYQVLLRITRDYNRPVIEITENGGAFADKPDERGVIRDPRRVEYYQGHLDAVALAIEEGADVSGYHAWTLLDNFGFTAGYEPRFGFIYVDFATLKRTPKESAAWYGRVAQENAFSM
jgi:beta-glucosidase